MQYLPINLRVDLLPVLVVGGGTIALQKIEVLLKNGARVRVVAPAVHPEIERMPIELRRRRFAEADLDGVAAVIAATDYPETNLEVHRLGKARGLLVNVVDVPDYCDFIFPSILRRGPLAVSVSTGGAGPALARMLRERLEGQFHPEFGRVLDSLRELRAESRRRTICAGGRRAVAETMSMIALGSSAEPAAEAEARMRRELEAVTSEGPHHEVCREARRRVLDWAPPVPGTRRDAGGGAGEHSGGRVGMHREAGRVILVGAGPGDPELITMAGLAALRQADMVVFDRLVNRELLAHAPGAEHVYIGKSVGEAHDETQARINATLIGAARAGKVVVRLKGGDPYIFGRGGEEARAALEAGVAFSAVPGVSAAQGAAAGAMLPLTQRGLASSVAFITGCTAADLERGGNDWEAIARAVDTVVLYMGVRNLPEIARRLIDGGRPAAQGVAIVTRATWPGQAIRELTLGQVSVEEGLEGVEAPSIIIIGEVVKLRGELSALAKDVAGAVGVSGLV